MGDMADEAEERAWREIDEYEEIFQDSMDSLISNNLWETIHGELLHMEDMQTSHINNCINMIRRKKKYRYEDLIGMFEEELNKREKK